MRTVAASSLVVALTVVAGCRAPADSTAGSAAPEAAAATARAVAPAPAVGAIFLAGAGGSTCTGSVVHSRGGNLILTAAHCLATGFAATFVPAFSGRANPAETWTVDSVYLDPRWVATQDARADYAFAKVSRPAGGALEVVVRAAFALGVAPRRDSEVTVTGYPLGGAAPIGCDTVAELAPGGFPTLHCGGLVDGTSGAPWIRGSQVVGLIGGLDGGGCQDSVSYSPPFDEATAALLARAEAGGPGDDPPNTFADRC